MRGSAKLLVLVALSTYSCVSTRVVDYRAGPVKGGVERRLEVERAGVRVVAGPPVVFPYARELGKHEREVGQYQLYTRVLVQNRRGEAVEVLWSGARLEGPEGWAVELVEGEREPAPGAGAERVEPGGSTVRVLLPETLRRIAVDEPLVGLCDGCEYRLVLPVRVGGREERLELGFRLEALTGKRSGDGSPRW